MFESGLVTSSELKELKDFILINRNDIINELKIEGDKLMNLLNNDDYLYSFFYFKLDNSVIGFLKFTVEINSVYFNDIYLIYDDIIYKQKYLDILFKTALNYCFVRGQFNILVDKDINRYSFFNKYKFNFNNNYYIVNSFDFFNNNKCDNS